MRANLKRDMATGNKVQTYQAEYSQAAYRHTNGILTPTICLKNIVDQDGNLVADHMWFNYSNNFRKLGELHTDDKLTFRASVRVYHKGHGYSKADYKLTDPKSVQLLTERPYVPLPNDKKLLIGYILIKNHMHLSEKSLEKADYAQEYMNWAMKKYQEMTGKKAV